MIEADNSYGSLEQIRQRKLKVKGEIHAQEDKMRKLWDSVFHSTPDTIKENIITYLYRCGLT